MLQEPFSKGNSQIHRLDPRFKVVFATVYAFVVALSNSFPALIAALIFSFALICLCRLDFLEVAKRVALVNGFIIFLWLVVPLTYDGQSIFYLGPFGVSREGVLVSARITLKSNAILLAFIALIASNTVATLGNALGRLKVPEKIIYLLLLNYRYIFVMEEEYRRLLRSASIRGFRPSSNLHTYKTYAYLIGILFVRAANRAERVYKAMLCRGFSGRFYSLHEFSFSRLDWIWLIVMTIAIIGLEVLEWVKIA
ncbi:MAG: cobalt ECF transporter T component CbiQ [Deltaproteobacteria bacterium]|nr:cobalt ECF transporter T component CbiQ [Deltaproteobacteria bacterium]